MNTACNAWVDEKKTQNYTNKPSNLPAKTKVCGDREFWFHNGEDQGNKTALEIAKCTFTHEKWRTSGVNKYYPAIGGPGACGKRSMFATTASSALRFFTTQMAVVKPLNLAAALEATKNQNAKNMKPLHI